MFSIHVERTINKPIEKVFAILSDHANYAQFKAIEQSNLLIKGKHETNGLGAVREIIRTFTKKSLLTSRLIN